MEYKSLANLLNYSDQNAVQDAVEHLKSKFEFRDREFIRLKNENQAVKNQNETLSSEYRSSKEKLDAEIIRLKDRNEQLEISAKKNSAEILRLKEAIGKAEREKKEAEAQAVKSLQSQKHNQPEQSINTVSDGQRVVARHPDKNAWYKVEILKTDSQNEKNLVRFSWENIWVDFDDVRRVAGDKAQPASYSRKKQKKKEPYYSKPAPKKQSKKNIFTRWFS